MNVLKGTDYGQPFCENWFLDSY